MAEMQRDAEKVCPTCGLTMSMFHPIHRTPAAETRAALKHLVAECEEVMDTLASLNEDQLPAWIHNCWHKALQDARQALTDGAS